MSGIFPANTTPFKDEEFCPPLPFAEQCTSFAQFHSLHGAAENTKRHAIYLPTFPRSFLMGALPGGRAPSPPPFPITSDVYRAQLKTVLERIKQRENLIHQAVRSSRLFRAPGKILATSPDIGRTSIEEHQVNNTTVDSASWISGQSLDHPESGSFAGSQSDLRVRFVPLLSEEKENSRDEALERCLQTDRTSMIPCNRFDCSAVLDDVRALTAHLHIHRVGEQKLVFDCTGCGRRFSDKSTLDEHRRACIYHVRRCTSPLPSSSFQSCLPLVNFFRSLFR